MKNYHENKLFLKQMVILATPIALQNLITIGVNMLDNIMVGMIGETELSAVSLANQFIHIYQILCMGLGMGAGVLVSRYWGMKKKNVEAERASLALKKTICVMLRITVTLAALFAIVTFLIPEKIMRIYTVDSMIIQQGDVYLRYSVITYFFVGLSLVCTNVLRSTGEVKLPLFVSIGAFFINMGANYLLIFGKFGMPRMGIAGAALGTLIARLFETFMICGYILVKDDKIAFRIRDLGMYTRDLLGEYIRISIPVLISDGILALGTNAVAMVIGRLGAAFVAANAITGMTQQLSTVLVQGVSQTAAIMTGQTLGKGEKEKALSQGYLFLVMGIVLGGLSSIFILIFSNSVIQAYQVSETTAAIAEQLMQAISLTLFFQATNSIMTKGVLRGGGDTKMLMLMDNIFLWIFSIPLGIFAGFVLHLSPFWIYICLKFDQIAKAIWCVFRLRSGKWIKKISTTGKKCVQAS